MSRKVIISKTAENKLDKLFSYLIENWSIKIKNEFIDKLDASIQIIKNQPDSFPESKSNKGLRKCVITKQTSLFYRFNSKNVFIVTVFDTRQHPKKFKVDI